MILPFFFGFLVAVLSATTLSGEIERISVSWNTIRCNGTCIGRLETGIRSIGQISDLHIDDAGGIAEMKWNSSSPFSFEPFRLASGFAGIRFNDIRLKIKGKIDYDGKHFYLISDRDFTRFLLIGPVKTEPGRYAVANNMQSRPIPADMQDLFYQAHALGQTLFISGPLFLPRTYPNVLITEQMKILKKDSEQSGR